MVDICTLVARLRFEHHGNMFNVNNVLNQLGLRSDERAEKIGKRHTMIIVNDIFPRLGINPFKDEEGA